MDETAALNNNLGVEDDDRIRTMFANRSIFISGGTGFMGKVLVEKLLRYEDGTHAHAMHPQLH